MKNILDLIYPIGSLYISENNFSPSSFLGGTWVRYEDYLGTNATSNFGTEQVIFSPDISLQSTTLTASQSPRLKLTMYEADVYKQTSGGSSVAHSHKAGGTVSVGGAAKQWYFYGVNAGARIQATTSSYNYRVLSSTAQDNLAWPTKTAEATKSHTHTVTVTSGKNASVSHDHFVTDQTITLTFFPYVRYYMWYRTA